ncbi:hypothetical protein ACTL6U_19620, partial [Rhodovibrionaceae bacterium A322]
ATDATFELGFEMAGEQYRVETTFDDTDGHNYTQYSDAVTVIDADQLPTGSPVISGNPTEGLVLTADTSSIVDLDGLGPFTYRWESSSDGGATDPWTVISDSTDSDSYQLNHDLAPDQVRVVLVFSDLDGHGPYEMTTGTVTVIDDDQLPTGNVTISGSPTEGLTLTADISAISDPDGLGTFSYQWQKFDGTDWVDVANATDATFELGFEMAGEQYRVETTFDDTDGHNYTQYSDAVTVIDADQLPTGSPVISGNPTEGLVLTADTSSIVDLDGLGPFTYRWESSSDGGATDPWTVISDSTDSDSYQLNHDLAPDQVRVVLVFSDLDGHGPYEMTTGTVTVIDDDQLPTGNVTISGSPTEGLTLTADISAISDPDGLGTFSYQWQKFDGTDWVDVANATDATFELGYDASGDQFRVEVEFDDTDGHVYTLTSDPTAVVDPSVSHYTIEGTGTSEISVSNLEGDLLIGAENGAGEVYLVFADQLSALDVADGGAADGNINLADMNGTTGYIFEGIDGGDAAGTSVASVGDVDGDTLPDLLIGAPKADINGSSTSAGESYLIFGSQFSAMDTADGNPADGKIDLDDLWKSGVFGYIIRGMDASDFSGISVSSAGDVNNDGLDDLIIGADKAEGNGQFNNGNNSGEAYVLFGSELAALDNAGATAGYINLDHLDKSTGFQIIGADQNDHLGFSVASAGDLDGDGFDDLVVSSPDAGRGEVYVLLGGQLENLDALGGTQGNPNGVIDVSDLDVTTGFTIVGEQGVSDTGYSVSSAGQVNLGVNPATGLVVDDLLIGARSSSGGGDAYLIFGDQLTSLDEADGGAADGVIDLSDMDQTFGYVFEAADSGDQLGHSVASAGDVDGDGVDDILLAAPHAESNGSNNTGQVYLVYGSQLSALDTVAGGSADGRIDLSDMNQTHGVVFEGLNDADKLGWSVSSAGYVDDDAKADLLIGDAGNGDSFLVFGAHLSALDAADGSEDGYVDLSQDWLT